MATTKATKEDVARLAALSRIAIAEEDLEAFASEFDGILAYVGKLDELTLPTGGERVVSVVRNVLRPDETTRVGGEYTEAIVAQFPQKNGTSLSVKQIISHD
jgi:aspartyl-tRNA(Asn)/glutamyl-tRNA(Gln) amidotransferase subunit C